MKSLLVRFARWLLRKSAPASLGAPTGIVPLDPYRRYRPPTSWELLAELKNTAWACASINAGVCATFPPKLYVTTMRGQAAPRCLTRAVHPDTSARLRAATHLTPFTHKAVAVEEVVDHPLLTLLRQVNPVHNAFDLWELTELYLEVQGCAYWLFEFDPRLQIPSAIWTLPAHLVTPRRALNSTNLIDYYEFRGGGAIERFPPERILHFRFPDPRDPYTSGLSPLRACYEQAVLTSEYAAMKRSLYENTGLPSVLITPEGVADEAERKRIELGWQQKFARGGQGQALVAEEGFKVHVLSRSMGDLAALADMKATKEDIANAFHVPLPFLTGDTNLANMQAADHLHKTLAIVPRLRRRDEKLNEQLVPLFDPSGRLFLASDDPTPANNDFVLRQEQADLRAGVRTINEVRSSRGLAAVPWGDRPLQAS
jgi:HK97 family phage portal protein